MSWDLGSVQRATELYREVIRLDPEFANAYASLANALTLLPLMGGGQHNTDEAESLARTAISMDDSLSIAHLALAHVSFHRWKWKLAEAEFRRAVESDPQNGSGHHLYAMFLVARGRCDEAIEHSRKAADLHPTTGVTLYGLAHVYFHARRYAEAIQQHIHTLNMVRHYPITYAALLRAYVMNGSLQEAESFLTNGKASPALPPQGPGEPICWRGAGKWLKLNLPLQRGRVARRYRRATR
jgi:pentatricopeptide repeat protein